MTTRFKELSDFIRNGMSMSHIYQPVMLVELLQNHGKASTIKIAQALHSFDPYLFKDVNYYIDRTEKMVGDVLTSNGITLYGKDKGYYHLDRFSELSKQDIQHLIYDCNHRLSEYIAKRGFKIWSYQKPSTSESYSKNLPGRHTSSFHCELCGDIQEGNTNSSSDINSISQSLSVCYACIPRSNVQANQEINRVQDSKSNYEKGCIFCELPEERIVGENELCIAIEDAYPVTKHHTLIIPKRHSPDYFSLSVHEKLAIDQLLQEQRKRILDLDASITGFNIGNNIGEDAGQTVSHCHTHLIPRRHGDIDNPKGGVRGVIPDKQQY